MRLALVCVAVWSSVVLANAQQQTIELTVDGAVTMAMSHNVQMSVQAAELMAATAEAKAAGRPEPIRLSLSPASIWDNLEAAVSAVLDLSGRRKWASRAARHELAATVAGNEEFRLELAAATRSTYWHLRSSQERLMLAGENLAVVLEIQTAFARLVEEGMGRQVDLDQATSDSSAARGEQELAAASVREAQADLAMLIGVAPETDIAASDDLDLSLPTLPSGPELQDVALGSRPAMRRVQSLARASLASAHIAGAEHYPDLEVSLEREEGVNFGRGLLDLPLIDFGSIRHGKRAAHAYAQAAVAEVDVIEAEIRQEVQSAAVALKAAMQCERRLAAELLPRGEDLLGRLERAREAGSINRLEVLEARGQLMELRFEWLDAVEERLTATVRVERAVGLTMEEIENARDDA